MSAVLLDGKAIAARTQSEIAETVKKMQAEHGVTPGLVAVLVGENPASQMYVRMKRKRAEKVGITSTVHELPASASQAELESLIDQLNADPAVHGILVQLPLPDHMNEQDVLLRVSLDKDVDGFHPVNIGRLAMKGREPDFIPATPYGCLTMLREAETLVEGFSISGSNAVVLGRSNIVGMPMALLLVKANATTTVCHSRTRDLQAMLADADIVVSAMGRAHSIPGDWVKPGAVIVDVTTVKVENDSEKGYEWQGDIEPTAAMARAAAMTPVPGGAGPMTIAMLLKNTLHAAELAIERGKAAST